MTKFVLYKQICFFSFFFLVHTLAFAQVPSISLKGSIWEKNKRNEELPIQGVKIIYSKKTFAFTDKEGRFELMIPDTATLIVVQSNNIGKDTITLADKSKELKIVYPAFNSLRGFVVKQKKFATEISLLSIQKTERIGSKELLKAACCNLSESFETTPSVDVAFTDAVTGYKQIQLLGLAGPYTLISRENIPEVRGIASITGLTFTPGHWIEGMQLSKGTGSVVNGYEGLAGQINIELRKPMEGDKQFYNYYQSNQGRSEANVYLAYEPKEGRYTNIFLHGKSQWLKVDQNKDNFIDQPLGETFILSNRWMIFGKKGRELQVGGKLNTASNWGGNENYEPRENPFYSPEWGMKMKTSRIDTWAKIGKAYEHNPWKSMGLQLSYSYHTQQMLAGQQTYDAEEGSLYANYIYQTIIKNTNRILKFGGTMQQTNRTENVNTIAYNNTENVIGAFTEYAHTFSRQVNMVLGLRLDYNSLYGLYTTPRLHIRYAPSEKIAFRGSFGRAYRSASIFSENLGLFASNRTIQVYPSNQKGMYGLDNEDAINTGLNATYKFTLNYRPGTFSTDYYYTYFLHQVVGDWEKSNAIRFYSSDKKSFAHSFQCQLDYEIIRKMDIRLAYRYHDIQTTYSDVLLQKPLNAKHRAFINWAYETRNKWSFDYTIQWIGKKRIPSTLNNPEGKQFLLQSPSYFVSNMHLAKALKK
jgi:outer membrane receptor for ferrienterochelin and colicins